MMTQDGREITSTMSSAARPAGRAGSNPGSDVIVIGGGIIGAATAYFLVRDPGFGGRVLVLEADPTYAHAATALSASSIRQQFSSAVNVRCSQFGIEFLRGAAAELAIDGPDANPPPVDIGLVERTYLYLATEAGRPALSDNVARQRALGVQVELEARDALRKPVSVARHDRARRRRLDTHWRRLVRRLRVVAGAASARAARSASNTGRRASRR